MFNSVVRAFTYSNISVLLEVPNHLQEQDLAVRRKIEKHREKVLHCDRVLQKNTFVQPVPSSTMKKSKKKQKEVHIVKDTNQNTSKDANGMTDLWDDKGEQYVSSKKDLVLRLDLHTKLEKHRGCVNTVSFSSDGDILVSGSDDRRVIPWDWQFGHIKLSFHTGHVRNVFQAKIKPFTDDRSIVTCATDGQAMTGALIGQETESGFVSGAVVGA